MKKAVRLINRLKTIAAQYALVLFMALLTSVAFIIAIETSDEQTSTNYFMWIKVGVVALIGISLLFALTMLEQRLKKKFFFQFLGLLFLVGFYFFVFNDGTRERSAQTQVIICAVVFALSHLFAAFSAYLKNENQQNFWEYNKSLFINTILSFIFSGVLTWGAQLTLFSMATLFGFTFEKIYLYTPVFISCFGSCFIFLLFIENGLSTLEKKKAFPLVLKFFVQFILIPLLIVYCLILYAYLFKIIFLWSLPRGWVSSLIIVYSLLGILALLLIYPLRKDIEKKWIKVFHRLFYYSFIPMLFLLFFAIFRRISDYGITENRYYVLLCAIWLSLITGYFILKKSAKITFIPKSLFILGVFSITLPFLNVFSTAERSQLYQFNKILEENKLLKNDKIDFDAPIQDSVLKQFTSKIEFLAHRRKIQKIMPLFDKKAHAVLDSINNNFWSAYRIRPFFKRIVYSSKDDEKYYSYRIETNNFNLKTTYIKGYDYSFRFYRAHQSVFLLGKDSLKIIQKKQQLKIDLIQGEETFSYDLTAFAKKTIDKYVSKSITKIETVPTYEFDLKSYHFKLLISGLSFNSLKKKEQKEQYYYDDMHGLLLVRKTDHAHLPKK